MSSDQSDVEAPTDLPKKAKKMPKSPPKDTMEKIDAKKLSTKEMIIKALSETKSRKGISLYAIKKYMQDNFSVDIEKINYLIKKNIKESVEAGTIIQTKGIGASGSFRLAPDIKQAKKAPKNPKKTTETEEITDKPKKSSSKKSEDDSKPKKKVVKTSKTVKEDPKESKKSKLSSDKENPKAGNSGMKTPKKKSKNMMKRKSIGSNSGMKTPKKKSKNMMKRKSIGSIIKPPRMKPSKAK